MWDVPVVLEEKSPPFPATRMWNRVRAPPAHSEVLVLPVCFSHPPPSPTAFFYMRNVFSKYTVPLLTRSVTGVRGEGGTMVASAAAPVLCTQGPRSHTLAPHSTATWGRGCNPDPRFHRREYLRRQGPISLQSSSSPQSIKRRRALHESIFCENCENALMSWGDKQIYFEALAHTIEVTHQTFLADCGQKSILLIFILTHLEVPGGVCYYFGLFWKSNLELFSVIDNPPDTIWTVLMQ